MFTFVLKGLPLGLRTWFALFGLSILFYNRIVKCNILKPLYGLALFALFSFISAYVNGQFDAEFLGLSISYLSSYLSSFFIIYIFQYRMGVCYSTDFLIRTIALAIFVHLLISLFMYVSPAINDVCRSIIQRSDNEASLLKSFSEGRITGFISSYFGAGCINGLGLILIVYIVSINRNVNLIVWNLIYVLILMVGILMARTVLVGFAFSMFFLFIYKWGSIYMLKRRIKWLTMFLIFLVIAVLLTVILIDERILLWAFEMFVNYFNGEGFSTESSDALETMTVLPDNLQTWIIGDGLYTNLDGTYYMETDIGLCRLLFYGGVMILLAFFSAQLLIVKNVKRLHACSSLVFLMFLVVVYTVALNIKGHTDSFPILFLLYMSVYFEHRKDYDKMLVGANKIT